MFSLKICTKINYFHLFFSLALSDDASSSDLMEVVPHSDSDNEWNEESSEDEDDDEVDEDESDESMST